MTSRIRRAAVAVLLVATSAIAAQPTRKRSVPPKPDPLLAQLWPSRDYSSLSDIGAGKAIIFSPDLALAGNRRFYERLGFLYLDDPSWDHDFDLIAAFNRTHQPQPIRLVVLETHGTNGNGLKLQDGYDAGACRSYVSMGGLQERLSAAGVRGCVIAACNSGRLFRPSIYRTLNANVRDKLFLPATLGILDATEDFDPTIAPVVLARRDDSRLETTSDVEWKELSAAALALFGPGAEARPPFVVSDMFVQLVTGDARLRLTAAATEALSRSDFSEDETEAMIQRFLRLIDRVAEKERAKREKELRRLGGK